MKLNTITWNEETKMYEVQNKLEFSEEEFNTLIDSIFTKENTHD